MLRTFCSNPTIGGFGSESTASHVLNDAQTPDAFCQIIKELVDNAVDACDISMIRKENYIGNQIHQLKKNKVSNKAKEMKNNEKTPTKRVRVVIEPFTDRVIQSLESKTNDNVKRELLRVTVTDNGCGMNDIEACVGAFHSSKAHNSTRHKGNDISSLHFRKSSDDFTTDQAHTVGRYGIGLTLCLLHAQRLVPDSCASIQSALPSDREWKLVTAVVDTDLDRIQCFTRDGIPKSYPTESGTSISILVPGGSSATIAWPRLAEYFARFKLSLGMVCSLEVLAPTLSRVPLWIQPNYKEIATRRDDGTCGTKSGIVDNAKAKKHRQEASNVERSDFWEEVSCQGSKDMRLHDNSLSSSADELSLNQSERIQLWNAVKDFLGYTVDLANVSHATVPIRIEGDSSGKGSAKSKNAVAQRPQLTVDVIVHDSKGQNEEFLLNDSTGEFWEESGNLTTDNHDSLADFCSDMNMPASMVLIRMVNKIPLLDSAEAVACGLVQCLASKKRMWNSFGLDVHLNIDPKDKSSVPTYDVHDSEQVLPFFKQGAHSLLEDSDDENVENFEDLEGDHDGDFHVTGSKRSRPTNRPSLLPAAVRLGCILVVVEIRAEPSMLPLPTLSKGRLPIGNKAIDDAFEIGVTQCLQQLQKTNPNLLLTALELRRAECDARYVPAVSLAIASILSKSTLIESREYIETIQDWKGRSQSIPSNSIAFSSRDDVSCLSYKRGNVQALGLNIERQLRAVLSCSSKSKATKENCEADSEKNDEENKSGSAPSIDDIVSVLCKKGNKKSKGSEFIHEESPDNETTDHIEEYHDFDEWF